jgi:hypothetical protein
MLDVFLEAVSGQTKVAEVRQGLRALLERLPTPELQKIASGEAVPKVAFYGDSPSGECWLDKFKGTPQYDQALELEKEDLDIQMQEQHRRQVEMEMRAQLPTWDEVDLRRQSLSVKRKLLELDLAGANLNAAAGGQEGEDAAPPDLEAAEEASMPPVPKAEAAPVAEEEEGLPPPEHAAPPHGSPPHGAPPGHGAPPPHGDHAPPGHPAHAGPPAHEHASEDDGEDKKPPHAEASGEDSKPSSDSDEDKSKDKKPPVTKVTTVEKPTEPKEKVDIKQAAMRMRFALAVKEAQPAIRARAFRSRF